MAPLRPPSAVHGQKQIRPLGEKLCLRLWREDQISVAFFHAGQRRKDPAADAEICRAHVRAFLCAFKAQRNPPKIGGCHHDVWIDAGGPLSLGCVAANIQHRTSRVQSLR